MNISNYIHNNLSKKNYAKSHDIVNNFWAPKKNSSDLNDELEF